MNNDISPHARLAACTFEVTLVLLLGTQRGAAAEAKPIVDVRFDAPYQQIVSSSGDEWAPTWGRDDVLYTGSNDGTNFGGIPDSNVAIGKLEGRAPYQLKGTTVNAMREFREPQRADWTRLDSYEVNGVIFRFAACGSGLNRSAHSCLVASNDHGQTWLGSETSKPLFQGRRFSEPSFIRYHRSGMHAILLLKDPTADQYIYAVSPTKVGDLNRFIVGRVLATKLAQREAADWSFQQEDETWKSLEAANPVAAHSRVIGLDDANWKTTNSYSVDGVLYMFVTRCLYPTLSGDANRRHVFRNSSVIKSIDDGRTWTRSAKDNYETPMFPGTRFGTPYFVWYGKDGAADVDNADQYIYAVSNNGYFEAGDDYIVGRVPRTKLPHLSSGDWSFYKGGDGLQDGSWTATVDQAVPVLASPGESSMTGMTYIGVLRRYAMVVWHYSQVSFATAIANRDFSTVLDFFEAPKPWGPWTKVKSFKTGRLGWYAPLVGQRFQTTVDAGTVQGFLYATGLDSHSDGSLDLSLYKLNYMPITLSTQSLDHANPAFVGGR